MKTQKDILWLILGAAIFGVLMGSRELAPTALLRSLVAGVAFIILGLTIQKFSASRKGS
jgi:hypothetical protein